MNTNIYVNVKLSVMRIGTKFLLTSLLILLMTPAMIQAGTSNLTATSTTSKGTSVTVKANVQNDGIDSGSNLPIFNSNKTYGITIQVIVNKLGSGALDVHDIAISTKLYATSSFAGDIVFYSGYYFDSHSRLLGGQNMNYTIAMLIEGGATTKDAKLEINVAVKENVAKAIDPTTKFNPLVLDAVVNPSPTTTPLSVFDNKTLSRSIEQYASKGSKIGYNLTLGYEGTDNVTSRPYLDSYKLYKLSFNVTLIQLGTNVVDFHDIAIRAYIEDNSITNYIPRSSSQRYFSSGTDMAVAMSVGQTLVFNLPLWISTNINDTKVTLYTTLTGKENVPNAIDPKSNFPINVELLINKGKSNSFLSDTSTTPINIVYFIFPFIIAIPIYKKFLAKKFNY